MRCHSHGGHTPPPSKPQSFGPPEPAASVAATLPTRLLLSSTEGGARRHLPVAPEANATDATSQLPRRSDILAIEGKPTHKREYEGGGCNADQRGVEPFGEKQGNTPECEEEP